MNKLLHREFESVGEGSPTVSSCKLEIEPLEMPRLVSGLETKVGCFHVERPVPQDKPLAL